MMKIANEKDAPIVITGANGHVGSLIVDELLASGLKVRVVARDLSKVLHFKEKGAEIRIGVFKNSKFMTDVFTDAKAAFVMTPLPLKAANLNDEQVENIRGIIDGIKQSGLGKIVLLSSWGTELAEKSGGIIGCRLFEQMLDELPGIDAVFLRPVWFMENFLYNLDLIKMSGINGMAIDPEVSFPMIATHDIAVVASRYLNTLDFQGKSFRYLMGPGEYSMNEVTRILGRSIGMPDMQYIEFPMSVMRQGMVDSGKMSPDGADMLIEINRLISNQMLTAEPRTKHNTTPTTLEQFAVNEFATAYKAWLRL